MELSSTHITLKIFLNVKVAENAEKLPEFTEKKNVMPYFRGGENSYMFLIFK